MESILLLLTPLVLKILDTVGTKDAERFRELVSESVERRKKAVRRSEELDAPQDDARREARE